MALTDDTERLGVHSVARLVHRELRWKFREQHESDFGIDAMIEIADDGRPTGQLIAVQIKSGKSYFGTSASDQAGWVFRAGKRLLDYWLDHALPVVVVLYDPRSQAAFWQHVIADHVELAGTEFRMTIPAAHRLDGSAAAKLRAISTRPPHTVKYQLLVQLRETLGADHPETLEAADDLVDALIDLGAMQAARDIGEDTFTRRTRAFGADHPDTLDTANKLVVVLAGLDDEARLALADDTFSRTRRLLGEDDYRTLTSAEALVRVLYLSGAGDRAIALGTDTLARCRRVFGENDFQTARFEEQMAIMLAGMGDHAAAQATLLHPLDAVRERLGIDHTHTLVLAHNMVLTLNEHGHPEAARDLARDTLSRRRRVLGKDDFRTLRTAGFLVSVLYRLGDHEGARKLGEDTLTRRRRSLGPDHPETTFLADFLAALPDR